MANFPTRSGVDALADVSHVAWNWRRALNPFDFISLIGFSFIAIYNFFLRYLSLVRSYLIFSSGNRSEQTSTSTEREFDFKVDCFTQPNDTTSASMCDRKS